jgi:hypothetical protein
MEQFIGKLFRGGLGFLNAEDIGRFLSDPFGKAPFLHRPDPVYIPGQYPHYYLRAFSVSQVNYFITCQCCLPGESFGFQAEPVKAEDYPHYQQY